MKSPDRATYLREWRKKNPDKCSNYYDKRDKDEIREKAWLRRYGITKDWYYTTLGKQENKCAICETTEVQRKGHTHFHVDHNHDTGEVRGLLCDLCNRGLGYFKDDDKLLNKAVNYLRKHNENH